MWLHSRPSHLTTALRWARPALRFAAHRWLRTECSQRARPLAGPLRRSCRLCGVRRRKLAPDTTHPTLPPPSRATPSCALSAMARRATAENIGSGLWSRRGLPPARTSLSGQAFMRYRAFISLLAVVAQRASFLLVVGYVWHPWLFGRSSLPVAKALGACAGRCPCRAPANGTVPLRHKARPYRGSPSGRHIGTGLRPSFFVSYRAELRTRSKGVSPSPCRARVFPPCGGLECSPDRDIIDCRCRGR